MTKNDGRGAAAAEPAQRGTAARVVREWVVPVVLGLAIGGGAVALWPYVMHTPVRRVVDRWRWGEYEHNEALAAELRALGSSARGDLVAAFRRIEGEEYVDLKVWVGRLLASEPFFDSASLAEMARDPSAETWSRSVASVVLVETQRRDVDPVLALPGLLEWLEDVEVSYHGPAISAVEALGRERMIPPDWEPKIRAALLVLAGPRAGKAKDGTEDVGVDRARALGGLEMFLPDPDVAAAMRKYALEETEDDDVRAAAVRSLASRRVFDDVEFWKKAAQSPATLARQLVADNLSMATDPAYDAVLAPLHQDAVPLIRFASVGTQTQRRRPTMLDVFDVLLEDHDPEVRSETMIAAGVFKEHTEGAPERIGMMLRKLGESNEAEDVKGAALALHMITGQTFGFQASDFRLAEPTVDDAAVQAFLADPTARAAAVAQWRKHLGAGFTEFTDADREKVLEKLQSHADPRNVERATSELAKLRGK